MFKNPFKRSKSMATEQNEQAQDLEQEQDGTTNSANSS